MPVNDASPFGILNIDKPAGIGSRTVVDHVERLVRPARAGHAGTLDPLATGVLVVCVGKATRLVSLVQEQPKEYRARFVLGKTSDTDDVCGEIVQHAGAEAVRREDIEWLLQQFVGRIQQVPPQYSAVHVGGKRAYKLARQGRPVAIEPRTVEIYRLALSSFEPPEIQLEIECGSGTYVRSIGRDLGQALNCGAVMSSLVRTRIGPFHLKDAVALDALDESIVNRRLLPARTAVAHLSQYRATEKDVEAIRHGRRIDCAGDHWTRLVGTAGQTVAVLAPDGELACLAEYTPGDVHLAPRQVFLS